MKNHIKKHTSSSSLRFGKFLFVLGIVLMTSVGAFAQGIGDDDIVNDPDAPFDGGISLLVAAGVAYGAKQWRDSRKKGEEKESEAE